VQATHPILSRLVALDPLKTWSLIFTLFGDLEGSELTGTQIKTLLGHIGIKPEAIRVALHRLKSDGWIVATKRGREAVYRMSEMAIAETAAVTSDVYLKTPLAQETWCFRLIEEAQPSKDVILLNRNLSIVPVAEATSDADALVLVPQSQEFPDWIAKALIPERMAALANDLCALIQEYGALTDARDKTVFRLLVVHHWRRIALRKGSWAHASFLPRGPVARCHAEVTRFLSETDRISPV
jgi:phenylacetic acid degradation operon negative regulatory protein